MHSDALKIYGIHVAPQTYSHIETCLSDAVGIIDLSTYFDPQQDTVPRGDPAAELLATYTGTITNNFSMLYDIANFDAARGLNPEDYTQMHLTARPDLIYELRDLFDAAKRIQSCDSRTAHTAIMDAAIKTHPFPVPDSPPKHLSDD